MVGSVAVWRAFPNEPWSPDIDLVVALTERAIATSLGARVDDPRYVIDDTFIARRATRGVPLVDVLAASKHARPPVELLARTALALLRPGPRLAVVRCPHQIVVSFEGDVVVDGLDPEAKLRAWAPHRAHEAHVHAALLAAVAGGCSTYAEAALLVDDARISSNTSPVSKLLTAVAANDPSGAVDALSALPAERSVVAGMLRGLFADKAALVEGVREEVAMLDRRALHAWPQTIELVSEAELVAADLRETAARCRAAMEATAIERSDRTDPWWRRPWRTLVAAFSR